ncbi:hypothetical protein [Streptomyces sp. NPDC048644]|uniref:hypothetical protein n=1 Tax=Streptomyces sp. NPDC048644 TaxID=3365582 RepID=UPI00371C196D
MEAKSGRAGAAGCLVAALAAGTGFQAWLHGARPGLRGAFEGERDLSLLYVELPCMLLGLPALTLLSWTAARSAVGARPGRGVRGAVSGAVVLLTLGALTWACRAWLAHRVGWVSPES